MIIIEVAIAIAIVLNAVGIYLIRRAIAHAIEKDSNHKD